MRDQRKANRAEVAEWFEVSLPTVSAWIRSGCPFIQKGGRGTPWVFDLLAVAEWRYSRESKPDIPAKDSNGFDPDDLAPKDRKDWYEGEKTRVFLEEKRRNLITLDEYRTEMARMLKHVAHAFEVIPDTLERKCALEPPVVIAMQTEIDALRAWLADVMEVNGIDE